jgi:hypothetical protein
MQFEGLHRFGFIKTIWRSEAPLKCRIFAWLAALRKCSTVDRLEKKRIPHNVACVLHILETVTWMAKDWIFGRARLHPKAQRKARISLIHLTWWNIWKEGNAQIFHNSASPLSRIHDGILDEAKMWRDAERSRAYDLLGRPREPD